MTVTGDFRMFPVIAEHWALVGLPVPFSFVVCLLLQEGQDEFGLGN